MQTINYTRDRDGVIIHNRSEIALMLDGKPHTNTRWVVTPIAFARVQKENPDVEFVEQPAGPVSG